MKISTLALTAATATAALAQPHQHKHRHAHAKRDVTVTTNVPGPTAYAYMLDGKNIDVEEVCDGLKNHALKFADGNTPVGICDSTTVSSTATSSSSVKSATTTVATTSSVAPTTTSAAAKTTTTSASSSSAAAAFYAKSSWSSPAAVSSASPSPSSTSPSSSPAAASSSPAAAASSSSSTSSPSGGTGLTASFPDGQLDCSTFPSDYGAINLSYLGMGGWSGLQGVTIANSMVTNIVTGISGQSCTEGMMCSYACPPGYQKSQWPSTQGATGQSVGGLSCSGGKLHLTNPSLSSSLCIKGAGGVFAQNKASSVVSICRTDYPGTESETVPVEVAVGGTEELTCPDSSTYYTWQGKGTSAQYYLNPIGTSAATGCQWGSPGGNVGNYAPINFGVGASDGKTWLSIFQNSPTTTTMYSGTVEIQGNLSGTCKYSNGQYCGATGCNTQGCTVCSTTPFYLSCQRY